MKKTIFLSTIFAIFIAFTANASVVNDVKNAAIEVVDSTTSAAKATAHLMDTSSNFKMIYTDLKDGVSALAATLKVGAEHVYEVLVKQQIVNSITNVIIYLVFIIVIVITIKTMDRMIPSREYRDKNREDLEDYFPVFLIGGIILAVAAIGGSIYFTSTINDTVMGFVNPEYGAMQQVVNFVRSLSK